LDRHAAETRNNPKPESRGEPRQGYYEWKKRPVSAHDQKDAELAARIRELEADVRRLNMENAFLKKASAYFASQNL